MARPAGWRALGVAVLGAALLAAGASAEASCSTAKSGELLAEAIDVEADSSLPPGVLDAALTAWRACPNAGTGFPVLGGAARERSGVRVRYVAGNSQQGRCGYFGGGEIVLFASARDRFGRAVPCGAPATNLAHELGHVLGLADAPADPRCRQFVMSGDDPRPGRERRVQPEECAAADAHWLTPAEGAVLAHSWRRVEGGENLWLAADLEPADGQNGLSVISSVSTTMPSVFTSARIAGSLLAASRWNSGVGPPAATEASPARTRARIFGEM